MNTKEELKNFSPTKEYFIGVDSDGTVFNSMNVKHIQAMCPAVMEIWDIGENRGLFEKIWLNYNLYSGNRGTNRFISLLYAFEQLKKMTETPPVADTSALRNFVKKSHALSKDALREWVIENPSPLLSDVIRWSEKCDEFFGELAKGIKPFKNAESALELMTKNADIMAISSASSKGLNEEWNSTGLLRYVELLGGQETGNKKFQLQTAASGKYAPTKILIIGDAPGDLEAARSINALFFPIIPGKEEESWTRLRDEAIPCFFINKYHGEYEEKLIRIFLDFLCEIIRN